MHMSVRQVSIPSEPDSSYFLRLDWSGRDLGAGFQLLLTDGQNAWEGEGKRLSQSPHIKYVLAWSWTASPVWTHTQTQRLFSPGNILGHAVNDLFRCSVSLTEEYLLVSLRLRFCRMLNSELSMSTLDLMSSLSMTIVRVFFTHFTWCRKFRMMLQHWEVYCVNEYVDMRTHIHYLHIQWQ